MKRIPTILTGALFVLGCGAAAYAGPDQGQPAAPTRWDGPPGQPQTPQTPQTPPAPQAPPSANDRDGAQAQVAPQAQPQGPIDNDDDDDSESVPSQSPRHLGVLLMPLTRELREFFGAPADRGMLVARIEPNSAASRAGVQVGDVMIRVGPRGIGAASDVVQALNAQSTGRIRLSVIRQGHRVALTAAMTPSTAGPQSAPNQQQF